MEQLFNERAQTGTLRDETRSKLEAAESAREEIDAQVQTAEAAVKQGEALLEKARSDVAAATATIKVADLEARRLHAMRGYAEIVAPYDGVITRRNVDVGDLTTAGTLGQPLFTIARDDRVRISVSVPELFATQVDTGDRVRIRLQARPGQEFDGKVARTSWTLDARNRTLRTEIDVANPSGTLRPGLYAYATVFVEERTNALLVPSSAVVRQGADLYCVTISDGKAKRRAIVLGLEDGTFSEVTSGLKDDEAVVKAYAAALEEDQPVSVSVAPPPATKKP